MKQYEEKQKFQNLKKKINNHIHIKYDETKITIMITRTIMRIIMIKYNENQIRIELNFYIR